jgi:hypothetical protein
MKVKRLDLLTAEKDLLDTGVLYAINKLILHPLGMALAFVYDDHQHDIPIGLELVETPNRDPWGFSRELDEEGRAKLRKFLDDQKLPLINEHVFNILLNEPDTDFEAHYRPTMHRHLMGEDHLSPLLVRDRSTTYITYMPFTRKDLALLMGGDTRKRPMTALGLLLRAWRIDHHTDSEPSVVMLPSWFARIWDIMTTDFQPDSFFVGKVYGRHDLDRIYLMDVN